MCAANQDAKEAVKEIGETDGLIGVLGEVDSLQVRIGMIIFFSTCFLSFFPFHLVFFLRSSVCEL